MVTAAAGILSPLRVVVRWCQESLVSEYHQLLLRTMLGALDCSLHHSKGLVRPREKFSPPAPPTASALKDLSKCTCSSHGTGRSFLEGLALGGCLWIQTSAS